MVIKPVGGLTCLEWVQLLIENNATNLSVSLKNTTKMWEHHGQAESLNNFQTG